MEKHPYITRHFDSTKAWKYLIIGTFPPNRKVRENANSFADYFYGNKGSFWKIIEKIYPTYNFSKVKKNERIAQIKKWQTDYDIGITDTILECNRRDLNSSDDSDLIVDWAGYNHALRNYLIQNGRHIEKIIFTSSSGCNSAFETFKIIMRDDMIQLQKIKLITDLPSPSGSSNTAMFNVNNENTLGLNQKLFEFISIEKKNHLPFFKKRWDLKKKKKATKSKDKLPSTPKGLLGEFKIWSYAKVLPQMK